MDDLQSLKNKYEMQVTANKMLCQQIDSLEARLGLLQRALDDPSPDVQEVVIKNLDLVSRDAVARAYNEGMIAGLEKAVELLNFHAQGIWCAQEELIRGKIRALKGKK